MTKLLILADENIPQAERIFGGIGCVQRVDGRSLECSQMVGVDALLVRSVTKVGPALLEGSSVRFVGTATSGVDHIDQTYLSEQGIDFAHAPGSNANSVVEYVLSAIAALDNRLEQLMDGGCVGIVGYGHIGKALSSCLSGLGIGCRIYDPWLDCAEVPGAASLAQVLASDVVSLHPELTREMPWPSFGLLGRDELLAIGSDRLLINASRGPVVDNTALLTLFNEGRAPVTVLDVWEGEPLIDQTLLQKVSLGSAHIAGYSQDGKILATRMLYDAYQHSRNQALFTKDPTHERAQCLHIAPGLGGAALIRHLLEQRYRIRTDDVNLRQCQQSGSSADRAAAFDHLRRNYRERRELRGSQVLLEKPSQRQRQILAALGCRVAEPAGQPL